MMPRLFPVVYLLCYVYSVLSRSLRDDGLSERLRSCAVALNHSNDSDSYFQLARSVCKTNENYIGCMDYENTVSIQTDSVSHTDATSTIRVEINPNATVGQELFYYAFCVAYNTTTAFDLVACASNEGEPLEIEHRWEKNGLAYMRVGIFDQSSHRSLIGCNMSETRVAGNFGLNVGMKVYSDQHPFSHLPDNTPPVFHSSASPTPLINGTNNTYVIGNLTFVPKPSLTLGNDSDYQLYQYSYVYDYGDNSTVAELSDFNSTHLYEHAGDYSYTVKAFAMNSRDPTIGYYTTHNGTVVILEPVSNVSLSFTGHNNSIIEDTEVYLHVCTNGSFPIAVCWAIHHLNSSNASIPLTSESQCSSTGNDVYTCHNVSASSPCTSYEMSFSEKGTYKVEAKFMNRVSCIGLNYTFHVVAAAKPPIVVTATSAGLVVAIVIAVVVVLIILALAGYLPYRRYRNHMIETADFKFIDLTEKKPSVWRRFKQKASLMYAHIRSQKNADKIGLVNMSSEPQRSHGSVDSSSSSLGSCHNNNNTVT